MLHRVLVVMLALSQGCLLSDWTGNNPLPVDLSGQAFNYREYAPTRFTPEGRVPYAAHPPVKHDVVKLWTFTRADEWARDDGRGPDAAGGDREFTGSYVLAERRRDPRWLERTRPPLPGKTQKPLEPREEAVHPLAHRRDMAGGPGGAFDHVSTCPPGMVMTGVRFRRDVAKRTLSQAGALCRPEGWKDTRAVQADGSQWGEEGRAPQETAECPPGQHVLPEGAATRGPWGPYTVITALRLACTDPADPWRRVTTTLEVGFPAEPWLPMRCASAHVVPAQPVVGLRIIAGQRIDSIGLACDVPPELEGLPWNRVLFPARPTWMLEMDPPLRAVTAPLEVRVEFSGRGGSAADGALELPMAEADVVMAPVDIHAAVVVAPVDACVVEVTADALLLRVARAAGATCSISAEDVLLSLEGVRVGGVKTGEPVTRGAVLGTLTTGALRLRAVMAGMVPAALPLQHGPLGQVRGNPRPFFLALPGQHPPPVVEVPREDVDGGVVDAGAPAR